MRNNDIVSTENEPSAESAMPQEERLRENDSVPVENEPSTEITMTLEERLGEHARRVRLIYSGALLKVSDYARHAKNERDKSPVGIDEYPPRIAAISREILNLRERITAINDTWAPVVRRHKQDIDAATIKVSNGRGVETEKPAFPNEEARQTELTRRMTATQGWSESMLQVTALERAIRDLEILRQEFVGDFKVARLRANDPLAATHSRFRASA